MNKLYEVILKIKNQDISDFDICEISVDITLDEVKKISKLSKELELTELQVIQVSLEVLKMITERHSKEKGIEKCAA